MVKVPFKNFPQSGARAVLPLYIALPARNSPRSKKIEAVIDSGATHGIFHAEIGKSVGFNIETGKEEITVGVDGRASTIWFHDVRLYCPGGIIPVRAAFSYDLPIAGLLGMNGFFEHFKVTFDPISQQCELERVYQA